jgi:hypothetical protein
MKRAFRHYIDSPAQKISQVLNQRNVVEQTSTGLQFHKQINIAGNARITARDRTEHADIMRAMLCSDPKDIVALLPYQLV